MLTMKREKTRRYHAECRCGWVSAESYSRPWADAEAARHADYLGGHLTFVGWRMV